MIAELAALGATAGLLALFTLAGRPFVVLLGLRSPSAAEVALFSAGFSAAILQISAFVYSSFAPPPRWAILAVLAAGAAAGLRGWRWPLDAARGYWSRASRSERLLALAAGAVLLATGLVAMAPLTGSDAAHYHFSAPRLLLGGTPPAETQTLHAHFVGQLHGMILFGLRLGGERLALGLLWLGGALTAAATFVLARGLMPGRWALVAALALLLAPMAFWQMTVAGAPDIWMAFYTLLAVLAALRSLGGPPARWLAAAAFFAGLVAGGKLIGWTLPLLLCLWVLYERPGGRGLRHALLCAAVALAAGGAPLVASWAATGNPLFPFFTGQLGPEGINSYAVEVTLNGARAEGFSLAPERLLGYPVRLALAGAEYGLGQLYGPLVLALGPLVLLLLRLEPRVRLLLVVWLGTLAVNAVTSQSGRFLLPVFPIALSLVMAGLAEARTRGLRIVHLAGCAAVAISLAFGAASFVVYARDFLPVATGFEPREAFLERMAPDYRLTQFVNRAMVGREGRVLIFFRHTYYLEAPFLPGNPEHSMELDPARYGSAARLLEYCRRREVRWVVKAGAYPEPMRDAWEKLEAEGWLAPVATARVDATRRRWAPGRRETVAATLFRLRDAD